MSTCNSQNIGLKLHAFELGMLPKPEREEFEEHLLECTHCFDQVRRHQAAMQLLNVDQELQREIINDVEDMEDDYSSPDKDHGSWGVGFKAIVGVVLAAVLVLMVTYQFGGEPGTAQKQMQVLRFNSLRVAGPTVVYLAKGGDVRFDIPLAEQQDVDSVRFTVRTAAGLDVFVKEKAVPSGNEKVSIEVPLNLFEAGLHNVTIESVDHTSEFKATTYTFRVK